jgi:hypothetical protein
MFTLIVSKINAFVLIAGCLLFCTAREPPPPASQSRVPAQQQPSPNALPPGNEPAHRPATQPQANEAGQPARSRSKAPQTVGCCVTLSPRSRAQRMYLRDVHRPASEFEVSENKPIAMGIYATPIQGQGHVRSEESKFQRHLKPCGKPRNGTERAEKSRGRGNSRTPPWIYCLSRFPEASEAERNIFRRDKLLIGGRNCPLSGYIPR